MQQEKLSLLFTGTYTKKEGHVDGKATGIDVYKLPMDGSMQRLYTESNVINPSYLTISSDGNFLYTVNETGSDVDTTGSISAFRIMGTKGNLEFINSQPSFGFAPCYIETDSKNRIVLITNYVGGIVAIYPIDSVGGIGAASQVLTMKGKGPHERQDSPHPHSIILSPDEKFALVADLGTDQIMKYEVDYSSYQLIPAEQPFVKVDDAAGPRHMVFHPSGKFFYVINELNSTISVFAYTAGSGDLIPIETVSTLPDEFSGANHCADVHISENGKFLYGSNRGHNSIVAFGIDENDGTLSLLGHEPTRGDFPRNFLIDESKLYVANQNSDNIVVFKIGEEGLLEYINEFKSPTPVCLKIHHY